MFNILTIGDPHFKSDNGEVTEELKEKVYKLINDRIHEIDAVCILGDILHRHEKIDLHPFHRAISFLESIHKQLIKENKWLYILIGNHDRSNNRVFMTDEHVFNPLKLWSNTIVADTATIHIYPKSDFKILLMPYVPPGRFKEAYETIISEIDLEDTVSLVLAHQEFKGAKMNMITSNEGDPWDSLKPLCVSGHVHDYQILKGNLIYTGTPVQHGFSDTGKKTVSLFKFNAIREYTEERIDLKIKGKITIKCSIKEFDFDSIPINDFYIKVKCNGSKREIKTFIESKIYQDAINVGINFHFLELPTVEVIPGTGSDNILLSSSNTSFVKFSERIKEMLSSIDSDIKDAFYEIFDE